MELDYITTLVGASNSPTDKPMSGLLIKLENAGGSHKCWQLYKDASRKRKRPPGTPITFAKYVGK